MIRKNALIPLLFALLIPPIVLAQEEAAGLIQEIGLKLGILAASFFRFFAGLGGILAVLFLVLGGIQYIMGNAEAGKKTISWALIGLTIAILSLIIVSTVLEGVGIPAQPGEVLPS